MIKKKSDATIQRPFGYALKGQCTKTSNYLQLYKDEKQFILAFYALYSVTRL